MACRREPEAEHGDHASPAAARDGAGRRREARTADEIALSVQLLELRLPLDGLRKSKRAASDFVRKDGTMRGKGKGTG